jgi:hypothetical protein
MRPQLAQLNLWFVTRAASHCLMKLIPASDILPGGDREAERALSAKREFYLSLMGVEAIL